MERMTVTDSAAPAQPVVYVLHDNPEWIPPFAAAFEEAGVPLVEWVLDGGSFDLASVPPEGVFWSRLSASSHTRGRASAKEQNRAVVRWLEAHGRRVINGSDVIELEVSKVAQYAALRAAGFDVPKTIAVFGADDLSRRAREMQVPFITKHNQGGKGLGVRRFDSYDEFDLYVQSAEFEEPVDGITLLQEYVVTAEPFITRAEFIDGSFRYAVKVDTSAGSFELCPADACQVGPQSGGSEQRVSDASRRSWGDFSAQAVCAVPGEDEQPAAQFQHRAEITADHPLVAKLEGFLAEQGIEIAGVEFFEAADGRTLVYDINTNTNYNPDVEAQVERSAAWLIAEWMGRELAAVREGALAAA